MIQGAHRLRITTRSYLSPYKAAPPKCAGCGQQLQLHDAPVDIPAGYRLEATHAESGERSISQFGACPQCCLVFEDVNAVALTYEERRQQVLLAVYRVRLARELFDAGQDKVQAALSELATAFRCLEGQPGVVAPFSAPLLNDWVSRSRLSESERYCAAFVLHVADARSCWARQFDAVAAMEHWEIAQRAVFVEWAKAPWWA